MMEQSNEPDRQSDQEVHGHSVEGAGGGAGAEDDPDSDYEARACDAYERAGESRINHSWSDWRNSYAVSTTCDVLSFHCSGGRLWFPSSVIVDRPPDTPTEVKVGEIVGWRFWYGDNGALRSYSAKHYIWRPGINETQCDQWGSGFHCYKLERKARQQSTLAGYEAAVIGEIECWGTVYEHVDGYRAEFARIKSLHVMSFHKVFGRRRYERNLRIAYGLPH